MKQRVKRAKKLIRQHANYIVHITHEAKELGWSDKTVVKVSISDGKLIIEKMGDL